MKHICNVILEERMSKSQSSLPPQAYVTHKVTNQRAVGNQSETGYLAVDVCISSPRDP